MTSSRARLRTPYPYPYLELACLIAVVDKIAYNSGMATVFSPYSLGVLMAIEKVGLARHIPASSSKVAAAFAPAAKLLQHSLDQPVARRALLGALIGGAGGSVLGTVTDTNKGRGAMRGALTGAGLGLGSVLGKSLFSAGAASRALEAAGVSPTMASRTMLEKLGPKVVRELESSDAGKRLLFKLHSKALAGLGIGGLLGGLGGAGLSRYMTPPDVFLGSA